MKCWMVIIWFCSIQVAFAQQLHFDHVPLLINNVQQPIDHIIQDQLGLVYVASGNEIFLFNGTEYQQLQHPDSINEKITVLYADNRTEATRLWIGLANGHVMTYDGDFIKSEIKNNELVDVAVSGIVQDSTNNLWVAHYGGGLFVKRAGAEHAIKVKEMPSQDLYCIGSCTSNQIWVGSDAGLSSCSLMEDEVLIRNYDEAEGLSDKVVKAILNVNGVLFVGTHEQGIFKLSQDGNSFIHLTHNWKYGAIKKLAQFDGKEVWIITHRDEVFTLDIFSNEVTRVSGQDKTSFRQTRDVLIDRSGMIWLTGQQHSLSKCLRQFECYNPEIKELQIVCPISGSEVLLGSSEGLYYYNVKTEHKEEIQNMQNLNIVSTATLGDNHLFGTFDMGARLISKTTNNDFEAIPIRGLAGQSVISIEFAKDRVWFSTLEGVKFATYSYQNDKITLGQIKLFSQLTKNYVYDILIGGDESVYFATDGQGIGQFKDGNLKYFRENEDLNNHVYSLAKDNRDNIWAIDNRSGICEIDKSQNELVCGEFVEHAEHSALQPLGDDMLVFYQNGMSFIRPEPKSELNFTQEAGFLKFDPQLNSAVNFENEYVFVVSSNVLYRIVKTSVQDFSSKIKLNFIKAGDRKLSDIEKQVRLNANEHTLQFNMTGYYYPDPESVYYRYKLDGHDEDWKKSKDNNIVYSKLGSGKYTFRIEPMTKHVKSKEANDVAFEFVILPPIWKRWWFILIFLLFVASIFYGWVKIRERGIKREQELQNAVVERQYEVLKNQLNPHFLFNAFNNLIGYIEEDPKTAVTVVEKLSDFYRRILELKAHKLVSVEQEINLLEDYVYLLNKRFDNKLKLNISLKNLQGFMPPMTLQILVENVVKHNVLSASNPLVVEVFDHDNNYIGVRNNLKSKRKTEESTGIGLQNIDKRYRLLEMPSIQVAKEKNSFLVLLPKIQKGEI